MEKNTQLTCATVSDQNTLLVSMKKITGRILFLCAFALLYISNAVKAQDYSITTTGNAIVITDNSGNGDVLSISQSGSNILFVLNISSRTYSINGGASATFVTPPAVALAGATAITINMGAGNDVLNVGAFTSSLPSLTINGGTGDDTVKPNNNINFAANANLDIDMQNDAPSPGIDNVLFAADAQWILSGSGSATIKVSKNVRMHHSGVLRTVNGNLTIECNQQAIPATGNFIGVDLYIDCIVEATGSGIVTVMGKGGDASIYNAGIGVQFNSKISGGTTGTTIVNGTGGASTGDYNYGIYVIATNASITSLGSNVSVTALGGGIGTSGYNSGLSMGNGALISAGLNGTVTVNCTGGSSTGVQNTGIETYSVISSSGGNVNVTGLGGDQSPYNTSGIYLGGNSLITAGGNGNVTVQGAGGSAPASNSNMGVEVIGMITSAGGNINVTGLGDGTGSSINCLGIAVEFGGKIAAGGNGTVNVNGTGGPGSGSGNNGIVVNANSEISSGGGNINVTGNRGPGNTSTLDIILINASIITSTGSGGNITLTSPLGGTNPATSVTDISTSPSKTISFGNSSKLNIEIDGTTLNTQYQQLNIAGLINLNNAALNFTGSSYVPVGGETFIIVDNDGTDAITGTFSGLPQGAIISNFLGSTKSAAISYGGGTGNDVVLTVCNLTPTITGSTSFCAGSSTTLNAGSYSSYLWSTGATTQTIPVNTAGTFTVTVTNAGGCTGTASVTTTVKANPTPTITGSTSLCAGSSTTLNAGVFSSYVWSTGATTQTIPVNTAGTFTVTVTNAGGCTGTASATTTVNSNPTPTITGNTSFCAGSSTTLNAGSFSSYAWSTGATTQTIPVNTAGTFTVTVTNVNGCTGTASATTTVNSNPTPTITGSTSFCAGSSTTLNAGAYSSYVWSTGATTQTIPVNTAGIFIVTVTNANGCTGTTSATTTVNTNPTPSIAGNTSFCAGTSTALNAGTFSSYVWSTGATTQTIPVNTAGTFTVTVTNANGCTGTASATTTVNANPIPTISGNTNFCSLSSTVLDAGTYSSYVWSTGAITQTLSVNTAATFTVTVTNASGCTGTSSVTTTTITAQNWYLDADNDGHYVSGPVTACASPGAGYNTTATQNGDCDDNDNTTWQSASLYVDNDGDGYDNGTSTLCYGATVPTGYSLTTSGIDCDDNNAAINPGATEITCNGIDENCNGMADDIGNTSIAPTAAITDAVNNNICLGNSVNLSQVGGSLGTGASYKWYSGSCGGTLVGTGATISVTPSVATTYYVRIEGGCGNTPCVSVTVTISTSPVTSLALMPFTGMPSNVCAGTVATLSIAPVNRAAFYVWDAPTGSYFNGNPLNVSPFTSATPSVTVTFGSPSGSLYNIGVQAGNACGTSVRQSQKVRGLTSVPASISGASTTCANSTVTYSTASVTAASSYLWTITGDATVSGNGTSATVTFGPAWTSGTLCVASQTSCYTSPAKCISISSSTSTLNAISGAFTACPNSVLSYSVPPSTGAASYTWSSPAGSVISSGQGTSNVSVTFSPSYSSVGNICASVTSTCGTTSAQKCKTVAPGLPAVPSVIHGLTSGLCNQSVVYSCPSQGTGVTYTWTVPAGATIVSGQGTTSVNVAFGTLTTAGICVKANNSCGSSTTRCITVKGSPASPGAITATPSSWCANTSGIEFNVNTAGLSGSYALNWSYPSASVATYSLGGGNSTSLLLDWISGTGNINVTAYNACGSGTKTSTWSSTCREGAVNIGSALTVSPNPTGGIMNVNYTASIGSTVINVLDLTGRVVMTQVINSIDGANTTQLDLSKLAKGAYMISIQNTEGKNQLKVVVE